MHLISVQYLRAVAALLVVVFHITILLPGHSYRFLVGQAGVDIFFVISGIVMWISSRDADPGSFALRRVIRIVPLYWLLTLVLSFINTDGGFRIGFDVGLWDLLTSLFFIAKLDGTGSYEPILAPGWTLNLEMYFYLILTIGLAVVRNHLILFASSVLAIVVVVGSLFSPTSAIGGFYAQSIVFEFAVGLCIGWFITRQQIQFSGPASTALIIGGSLGILVLHALIPVRFLGLGLGATCVVIGFLGLETRLAQRPMRLWLLLGNASYSIYLIHMPVIAFCFAVLPSEVLKAWPVLASVSIFGLSLFSGVILHFGFERPVTRFLNEWSRSGLSRRSDLRS